MSLSSPLSPSSRRASSQALAFAAGIAAATLEEPRALLLALAALLLPAALLLRHDPRPDCPFANFGLPTPCAAPIMASERGLP